MTELATAAPAAAARSPRVPLDDRPFLCFCGQDWWYHNRAHSDFQLMTRIARERKVLLINSIGMRMPTPGKSAQFWSRVTRKLGSMAKALKRPVAELPDYWVMTPVLFPFYGSKAARAFNERLITMQVKLALRRAGINEPPHTFVTVPTALPIAQRIGHASLVYNRSDKHSAFGEADGGFVESLEQGLMSEADLVLYCSRELMEEEKAKSGDKAYFLDHGVDLEHFTRVPEAQLPPEYAKIKKPRIGFFGGLDDYTVDFDLIEKCARELPDYQLVLVGRAMCSMERFEKYDNVHWLDFKAYEEIPAYGSGFDVALMPWLRNEWIRHCNPIKLKEYLALGLDVVTTDFPELRWYDDVVSVAKDPDDFVALIKRSIDEGGLVPEAKRRARVDGATWDARTQELLEACSVAANARTSQRA